MPTQRMVVPDKREATTQGMRYYMASLKGAQGTEAILFPFLPGMVEPFRIIHQSWKLESKLRVPRNPDHPDLSIPRDM
jgi:hypothetical protein